METIPIETVNNKLFFLSATNNVGIAANISTKLPCNENLLSTTKSCTAINAAKIDIGMYVKNSSTFLFNFIFDNIVIGNTLGTKVTIQPPIITLHT